VKKWVSTEFFFFNKNYKLMEMRTLLKSNQLFDENDEMKKHMVICQEDKRRRSFMPGTLL
jgi:hypothetical protein